MPRTLILIVVREAERHLEPLLARLPRECGDAEAYRLLVVDDASSERPGEATAGWLRDRGFAGAEVLRSPLRLGHGGSQKLGCRYALDGGFDSVVLLHADGRHAPELAPTLIETLERTGAGVVLASPPGGARRRPLTGLQNLLTGRRLVDYQAACRAYSCAFLRSVPFEIAANGVHFDTEILLQAFTVGARVEEIELPDRGGAAVRRTGSWRAGADALASTVVYRMHHLGMLCSLKHRDLRAARYRSKSWIPYSSHARALRRVRRAGPRNLVDLGCGPGHVARRCEEMGVRVTGVDRERPLPDTMSEFHLADLERCPLPIDALAHDMVLMLDVLEHLANPEELLLSLRNASERPAAEPPARVVLTTPNVAFAAVRLNLLLGRFNYAERGILDITHKRLFTRRSLLSTLRDCGYRVEEVEGIGVPFEAVFGGRGAGLLGAVSDRLARLWPSLFAFQLLVVCRPLPGVRQLLRAGENRQPAADASP